jgi:hypothetical protein
MYSGSTSCGPDGSRNAGFSADALNPSALLGALIGKIGGSPAEKPDTATFTFAAGSYAIVVVGEKTEGPLYLTMNDQPTHFDEHAGSLTVAVETARSG